jgi:hypothetical protein
MSLSKNPIQAIRSIEKKFVNDEIDERVKKAISNPGIEINKEKEEKTYGQPKCQFHSIECGCKRP